MSYDTLERQIRMLPEDCLEEVSHYIEFVIYRVQMRKDSNENKDLSRFYGALKEMPDGLALQKGLRDEWN